MAVTQEVLLTAQVMETDTITGLQKPSATYQRCLLRLDAGGKVDVVLIKNNGVEANQPPDIGAVDHGDLSGLLGDDHTQYPLLAGRTAGQVLIGGLVAGEDLELKSTAHATKGSIIVGEDGSDVEIAKSDGKVGFFQIAPVVKQVVVDLTDNSGGVANDTLEVIPNPADAPVTADDLREDLVANVIPAIKNDLADLAAKINAILNALQLYGLVG
jgi:hypothetical protein